MTDRFRHILIRFRLVATIIIGLLVIVWPFAEALLTTPNEIMFCIGAAITVGVGTGLRVARDAPVGLGLGVGAVVGLVAAIVLSLLSDHQGPAEIIPPVVGVGIGFIDGIGAEKLKGRYRSLLVSLFIGGVIGLGTISLIGWQGFVGSCIAGVYVGTAAGMRISPEGRWRDGLSPPPLLIILINLALIIWGAALIARDEASIFTEWWMIIGAMPLLVLYPVFSFVIGRAFALWLRPRIQVFRELTCYLRVMWIPLGAFALGYCIIILVFAGFYGTLHKYAGQAPFQGIDAPTMLDWIFYSFLTATTMGSENVIPATRPAQLLVGLETIFGLSWIIIMFAAVMSHLQPQLEAIARGSVAADENPPDESNPDA